ncbi:MAG TPA: radical SAM protein [Candidatus Pacearchaeota archaeon]|nr:anaerobic sulfatase-maturating enzyme [archaeon BMS3Abin17]HDK42526.1 radical SAM protein [Candidatus Pacearchaeota archaeon]
MSELLIPTKKNGLDFLLNPDNGKWIISNNIEKNKSKLNGDFQFKGLKGTQLILFNLGRGCNLNCKYCFLGDKRNEKTSMSFETAKKALHRVSDIKDGVKRVVFHGSEPLLNYQLIKDVVNYGNKIDKEIKFSIQTNGTLLNSVIIDFLVDNNVYIGVSLDGLKENHNKTRPFKNGKGSYEKVISNLKEVLKKQGRASIITVVTKYNVNDLENIVNLGKEIGIQEIAFNPVLSNDVTIIPSENDLTKNFIKTTENYFTDLINNVKTPRLDHPKRYLSMILHNKNYTNSCLVCSAGPTNPLIAVDVDGTLYPCDHFWGEKTFAIQTIENITIDLACSSNRNFRNNIEFGNIQECSNCEWKRICSGGCPGGRIISNKAQYCKTTKEMLTFFVKQIPLLMENGLLEKILTE